MTAIKFVEDMDRISRLSDTGIRAKGMEVFDEPDNPNISTVIYLKTVEGKYFYYVLSGGP